MRQKQWEILLQKIGLREKKIRIIGYYRQWQILGKEYNDKFENQYIRFDAQTKRWEKMVEENINEEIILCGDFNINSKIFKINEENKSDYEKKFNPMLRMIKQRLNDNGLVMANKKETRLNTILDHVYTNKIKKIFEINQEDNTTSDHSLIEIVRKMKIDMVEETMIEIRNFKIINYDEINHNIINDNIYNKLLEDDDPNKIA